MQSRVPSITNRDPTLGTSFHLSLAEYEGPLDLLLQLIERQELNITNISLCAVTAQYIRAIEALEGIEMSSLADFLAVASRLLLIKSNRLLPRPIEEEEDEEDLGDALVRRLIEYRRFRQVADSLKTREDGAVRAHVRASVKPAVAERPAKPDLSDVDTDRLQSVLVNVLKRMPVEPPPPRVALYVITVSEQIDRVREFIRRTQDSVRGPGGVKVLFSAVLSSAYTRTEVIVTFLAVLELIKQQELAVEQDGTFGDIYLLPLLSPADQTPGEVA